MENRIKELERTVKLLRFAVIGLAVVLIAGVGLGAAAASDSLTAKRIVIVDDQGAQRLLLDATGINVFAPNQPRPVISIGAVPKENGGGTQIFMLGSNGQNGVNIGAQKKGYVNTY
jgi:hypothetical protein